MDWDRFRQAYSSALPDGIMLSRIRLVQSWLALSPEAAFAAATDSGTSDTDLRPFFQALGLIQTKLQRDMGIPIAPESQQVTFKILSEFEQGRGTDAEKEFAKRVFSGAQFASSLARVCPSLLNPLTPAELAKTKLQEQVLALCPRLNEFATTYRPGQMTVALLDSMKELLLEFQDVANAAAPDNQGLPFAYSQIAHTTELLAKGCIDLGKNDEALLWFGHAANWFETGEEPKHAEACRSEAKTLQTKLAGDLDAAAGEALNVLVAPAKDAGPLDTAAAYVNLSQVANDAGDLFEAQQYVDSAVSELQTCGFPDPQTVGVEAAVSSWFETSARELTGIPLLGQINQLEQWFLSIYTVRIATMLKKDEQAAAKLLTQVEELKAMIHRIDAEADIAREQVARELREYVAGPAMPPVPSPQVAADQSAHAMQAVDDALLETAKACNSRSWGSDPMDDLLARLDQIKVDAAALQMPLYDAKVMLERAYVLQALGRGADMLPLAKQARARLLGDRLPSLGSFSQGYERSSYLDTFAKQAEAQIITGDHEGLLATCEEVIRDFETERYRVNSPFRQSALLNAVVIFYKWAAFAAFKLSRWDNMLEVIELIKARSAIHSRLLPETPDLSESALTKEFEDVSKALELQGAGADPDLVARRRHLWDLLSIARAHGASAKQLPALTLSAVQTALAEDEALIGYFWLSDDTLLVMAVDHQRFEANRVTLKPDELQDLNDFIKALQQLRGVSRGMDKALRRFADILLPAFCRDFIATKKRLIVSPHHALHLIPLHALPWEAEFVATQFAIRYVPNFSSLLLPWENKCENRVLAIGIKQFADPAVMPLANVEDDASAIAQFYTDRGAETDLLLGSSASRERIEDLREQGTTGRFRCLHLGTHGLSVFDTPNQPLESKLLLQDSALDSMDIAGLQFSAELAVLSACHSGQRAIAGRDLGEFPGDDIFGLQSALFQSGVRSVLGTLWLVETESSSAIVRAFHKHFAEGNSAETSLQMAVKQYLSSDTRNKECFYWAPYFISSLGSFTKAATA